jgi:hypothetical protein
VHIAGACAYAYTNIVTFRAVDDCGNVATANQTLTAAVTQGPGFTGVPSSLTVSCDAVPNVTGADFCGAPLPVTFTEVRTAGSCMNSYTLNRTWNTTDSCGQTVSETQIITVVDLTPPTLVGVPADMNVECGFVPCSANVSAVDNCMGVTVDFIKHVIPGSSCCDYTLRRTWTAVDACGNRVNATQTITVFYHTPPVLTVPPGVPALRVLHWYSARPERHGLPPPSGHQCVHQQRDLG